MKNDRNKVCTVTTLMGPLNQTMSFVNYHLNIGIDHMFLFFDNPNDEAIDTLKDYKKVTCFRCDDEYWSNYGIVGKIPLETKQRINSKRVLKEDYDWVFHIDSDELIYLKKPLKKFLKGIPKKIDFVRLVTTEAVPEKIYYENRFKEVNLFKTNVPKLSRKYFKGNTAGKSVTRISNRINNLGIHVPEFKQGYNPKYRFSLRGRILHFDCCGFEDWKMKWRNRSGGKTIAAEMGAGRKAMISEFEMEYKKGGEVELVRLYKKQFFINSGKKGILKFFGLLRRINLNWSLFEKNCG